MQQKQVTGFLILAVVAILIVGTFVLLAVGVLRPQLSVLLPRTAPTAVPAEVEIRLNVTPSPVPTATPKPTALP